ncbi:armadillo-type protein [Dipodascopsis tothii]|uniref:armadillo-type protein n=1 Tax=Dipodascopsis tothii TaxID=44089 RepID=UPI0034CDF11F
MDAKVLELLEGVQSTAHSVRSGAEATLRELQLAQVDELATSLLRVASAAADLPVPVPIHTRQSALLTLKLTVARTWSLQFDEFLGEKENAKPISQDVKALTRKLLFELLHAPERKLRALAANVVAKIASSDFPDEWPALFSDLMAMLDGGLAAGGPVGNDNVRVALDVVKELLDDGFSFEQFGGVARELFEALYGLAVADKVDLRTKAATIDCVRAAFNFFNQVNVDAPAIKDFATQALEGWARVFAAFMGLPVNEATRAAGLVELKYNTTKAMQQLDTIFHAQAGPHVVATLFPAVWDDYAATAAFYAVVFARDEPEQDLTDPEGEPHFLALLALEQTEFVRTALTKKKILDLFRTDAGRDGRLQTLVDVAATLGQISATDADDWAADPAAFVTEEMSLSPKYTCRTAVAELLLKLSDHVLEPLLEKLAAKTTAAATALAARPDEFRPLEASLMLLENVLVEDRAFGQALARPEVLPGLLAAVNRGLGDPNEFLRGRTQIFAGTLCRNLSAPLTQMGVAVAMFDQALSAASADPSYIVRTCCLLGVQRYAKAFPRKGSKPVQVALVSAIETLLDEADEDTPALLLDALATAIKISPSLAVHPSTRLIELLFTIAAKAPGNLQLACDTHDNFEELAEYTIPEHYVQLCETAIPPLVAWLGPAVAAGNVAEISMIVDLLAILVDKAPSPLPSGLVDFVFPKIADLLLTADDNQVLQNGSEFVCHIIEHDPEQLKSWRSKDGKPGPAVVLQIIARLLDPAVDESSALSIGGVVSATVDKYGKDLGELLPQLLTATARRLETAQFPPLVQNLILVFAHMVAMDTPGVVNFLASVQLDQASALEVVVRAWLANFEVFKGFNEIRLNVMALANIYLLDDARVQAIAVQGSLIVEHTDEIITRSRAKARPYRYTTVPAHVKIIKLLAKELGPAAPAAPAAPSADNDGWVDEISPRMMRKIAQVTGQPGYEEDDDDDDADDYDDDDSLLDGGVFGGREGDAETKDYLAQFFREVSSKNIADFHSVLEALDKDEQASVVGHLYG